MKKILLLLLFICIPLSIKGMAYIKNYVSRFYPANHPIEGASKSKIALIYVLRDLDFKALAHQLFAAAENPEIDGILLIIDNDGGSTSLFSMLHDLVKKIANKKPVVGLITSAYSGAYLVASATTYLIAHSSSEIGNIGVVWEISKYTSPKINTKVKAELNVHLFQMGEYKTINNPFHELSEKDEIYIKKLIYDQYQKFITQVSENRCIKKEEYTQWAEGKVFISDEALRLGLIDEIGTIFEADAKLVQLIRAKNPDKVIDDSVIHIDFDTSPSKN